MLKQIGSYKVDSLVEDKPFLKSFLGIHMRTNEPGLIHVYSKDGYDLSQSANMEEYSRRLLSLKHDHLKRIYETGQGENSLYIIDEYLENIPLDMFLDQVGVIPLRKALNLILQIALALDYLHHHGFLGGNLTLGSISIDRNEAAILEFRPPALASDVPLEIRANQRAEQLPGNYAASSDIYSLGVLAYEIILAKKSSGPLIINSLPKGMQNIVSKCVQIDPADRFLSVHDFLEELSSYQNSQAMQEESHREDLLQKVYLDMQCIQVAMLPRKAPEWGGVKIGMIHHPGLVLSGVYYDFFKLPSNAYVIFLSESVSKGIYGLAWIAGLRGMLKTILKMTSDPLEIVQQINKDLCEDQFDEVFVLSLLTLLPEEKQIRFISCGHAPLWVQKRNDSTPVRIITPNIGLGIDPHFAFKQYQYPWQRGDKFTINTFSAVSLKGDEGLISTEKDFQDLLIDTYDASPQQRVDHIYTAIKHLFYKKVIDRCFALLTMELE